MNQRFALDSGTRNKQVGNKIEPPALGHQVQGVTDLVIGAGAVFMFHERLKRFVIDYLVAESAIRDVATTSTKSWPLPDHMEPPLPFL